MFLNDIGVLGMAVMGRNLALNIANKKYSVSIFNRSKEKTKEVILNYKKKNIFPFFNIKDFILSLKKPRIILLMVQSGKATDQTINSIIPYLSKKDIIIDGGNSFYKDTIKRNSKLSKIGLNFLGVGISGGEEGALNGPSIMPGGDFKSYSKVSNLFKKISAKTKKNFPCVCYIGPNGSGHYVKMVHNGIEYGDMQLIAESYFILKNSLNLSNKELSSIFLKWNTGELKSYLIEITQKIFLKKDSSNKYILDYILDKAENKGTGKWTSKSSLDLNEPLSLITQSVFFRYLSSLKLQRTLASQILYGPKKYKKILNKKKFIEHVRRSLYLGKIISYAQGFSQLQSASKKYNWNLNYSNISKIFRAGCIIRANFLKEIIRAYKKNNNLKNLLLTSYFTEISNIYQKSLRKIVSYSIIHGIPVPAFSAAISYYDSYRSSILPSNLIQAQRDYFGAHTYLRIDKNGIFHTNWLK
ncbi:MAG: NADP-dependent phosphogluconate dehydrogenase [Buchnera aphidicola (Periphyllus lyropictus)]|uniref:NADP-dependent phosphogluconate dehydrogenase n=1 Tax=Buchnera aphidicola TaxID=9 RepID=UPI001ECDB5FD|nr:NADP-dependent phosphogluconate dehydrogenase [Buchnera aphidicola]NIH16724.1 NADP-dependent phosphogluconate dehydrogenase [Buchnera aphidicola (Periphyllus lyropictus)]USS94629.1 NADP-dependent phosphogluconate dehydrogenase [Buchnera aphidicola (Periphyllus lyropictus)]